MADAGALVVYGRGAELGDLRLFADDLVTTELTSVDRGRVKVHQTDRRETFFETLTHASLGFKLKALHIISHAYGAALSLGYKDPALQQARGRVASRGRASYLTVLNTEAGMVFTDDLLRSPYTDAREAIRARFTPDAIIKIWGCNAAVDGWRYSDTDRNGQPVDDPHSTQDAAYYWRALHERHPSKPSIAQALADYCQVVTFGANSGTSIQVQHGGKWVSQSSFFKATGRNPPRVYERDTLRLWPDKGAYRAHHPR